MALSTTRIIRLHIAHKLNRGHASSRPDREGGYAAGLCEKVKCGMGSKITKVYVPTEIGVEHTE